MNAQIRPPARRPGPLKRLIRPLIKPDVFDFWASRLHRTWTWECPLARLVAREAASADAVTLLFKPNRHWAGHRAGQHVNLGIEIDGVRLTRSYSLTAPPRADGLLPITVKAIEGGKVSRHLCHDARMGDIVDLGQAFGEMTLPASPRGAFLLLAASGITPLMALVRDLAGQGVRRPTRRCCTGCAGAGKPASWTNCARSPPPTPASVSACCSRVRPRRPRTRRKAASTTFCWIRMSATCPHGR